MLSFRDHPPSADLISFILPIVFPARRLTMGHGKCQTEEELDAIIEYVEKTIAAK